MHPLRLFLSIGAVLATASGAATPAYHLAGRVALGAPDRWDYLQFDPASSRVYVAHGDRLTVVDARTGAVVGSVDGIAGGTHGTAISAATHQGFTDDGQAGEIVAFDPASLKVTRRIAAGEDADGMALDAATGRMTGTVPIGRGNDAVAFDPVRRRVFSSNGRDGTISVFEEGPGNALTPLPTITTAVSGRTMTVDPRTGRLFVAAARTDPDVAGGRPKVRPGTLELLMFDPDDRAH